MLLVHFFPLAIQAAASRTGWEPGGTGVPAAGVSRVLPQTFLLCLAEHCSGLCSAARSVLVEEVNQQPQIQYGPGLRQQIEKLPRDVSRGLTHSKKRNNFEEIQYHRGSFKDSICFQRQELNCFPSHYYHPSFLGARGGLICPTGNPILKVTPQETQCTPVPGEQPAFHAAESSLGF